MAVLSMILEIPYEPSQSPCCYGLTKLFEGDPPPVGMTLNFQVRPRREQGYDWLLDGGRVAMRVVSTEGRDFLDDKQKLLSYQVKLEPVSMTFEQLQELVRAPWFQQSGWHALKTESGRL